MWDFWDYDVPCYLDVGDDDDWGTDWYSDYLIDDYLI